MPDFDDLTIINEFLKGKIELLSNSNLQIKASSRKSQLLDENRKLISLIEQVDKTRSAWVTHNSEYWELLHQVLQQNSFVPLGTAEKEGFMAYEQHEIPVGYKMQYTEALNLWKAWYPRQQQAKYSGLEVELLIFIANKWHLIREILLYEGRVFIKTSVTEIVLHEDDKLVWLCKSHQLILARSSCPSKYFQQPDYKRTNTLTLKALD